MESRKEAEPEKSDWEARRAGWGDEEKRARSVTLTSWPQAIPLWCRER